MNGVICTDHMIDSGVDGLRVLLRNKHRDPGNGQVGTPILFVHGATYASTITFDYAVGGVSWMDWMADRGFDVWAIDLPGYGGSERPAAMAGDPAGVDPLIRTADAETATGRAIDFILAHRSLPRLHLAGYSWGTSISGGVAAARPDVIDRLVLYGVLWCREQPTGIAASGMPGAWRHVTADAIVQRWCTGLTDDQAASVATPAAMRAWADAAVESDPDPMATGTRGLRAPAGVIRDVLEYWVQGRPTWDPARIKAPTLVVVGERDQETKPDQGLQVFGLLEQAPEKRITLIGGATHSMLLETGRHALYSTVLDFLRPQA